MLRIESVKDPYSKHELENLMGLLGSRKDNVKVIEKIPTILVSKRIEMFSIS